MNLLIEQHPTTKTLSYQNDVKNNLSSSSTSLVLKLKRQTKQQSNLDLISLPMVNEDNNNNNSRLQTTNQRLKRPIPNSSTRRPSSPAFNGKQQVTKRSVTIDNNNNDLTSNIDENLSTKRFKQDDLNSLSTKVDASVETVSIGLATEPDQLGPCEPGTSVVLEGIVWNETDSGVLVVNVTWRGKTYVGTLLDSTKQDWACPRLTCESPTSDYDPRNNGKTSRSKRSNAGGNTRSSFHQQFTTLSSGSDDRKLRNNIKSRQSKRINETLGLNHNLSLSSPLNSPLRTNTTFFSLSNSDQQLISCTELNCHKQFVSTIALNYHLSNSHKKLDTITTVSSIQQANTRDEEDVAHILANVADYVRRPSPRSSPEHQRQSTTLTWPCPQISSNLVLSSSLNNNEQTSISLSTNTTRNILETNPEQDDIKSSTVKPADHFLLHIQDEPSIPSWTNTKIERINENKKTLKIPTPPPSSSFVSINIPAPPPVSSSPAYSDISDEDPTTTNDTEQNPPPSTINLLNEQTLIPNASWTTEMLLQQYGPYMQHVNKELISNCLNSKINPNGTSDSTVKNILDSRRSTTTTKSPSPPVSSSTNDLLLYHYQTNDTKLSLTSPNENLLNPSSSSIHPTR